MKFLLTAINAKYIHSNPGVYSLKTCGEGSYPRGEGLSSIEECGTGGGECLHCAGEKLEAEKNRVQVEIAEYTINNEMERILEDIYRRKPDVVGFSCYIWNIVHVRNLVWDLHKVLPETDIWLGGPEVSFDAPQLLEQEPEVLGVMKGEGEETFAGLVLCYEGLGTTVKSLAGDKDEPPSGREAVFWNRMKEMAGVTYRGWDGSIYDHPARPVMDMSRIPFPYRDLEGFENRIVYYESSRGCPFSCSYCLSSIDKSVRFRDLKLVKRELDFFLERRVPQVKFVDRTFNCNKSHAMAIWNHILERDCGVTNFHFEIAADLLDDEALALLARMRPGLVQLEIGVQSTNPDTLREIHRNMDLGQVRSVVERINRCHNIHQHLDLIAGLPCEDYESFHRSFNQVYAMEPEQLQLGFLKVLKGSCMHERAAAYGLAYRQLPPYEVLSTRWLSYGEILKLKGVEDMVEVYYNSRQFTTTLGLLEQEFCDAFVMFERLARFYEENRLEGLRHSRLARYEHLHRFVEQQLMREHSLKHRPLWQYEDALMQDLYLRENAKSRPWFAPDPGQYKEEIRALVPELRALGTRVHVEAMQSGEFLLFDYRERDRLTHNAQMQVIGRHGTGR